MSRRRWLVAAGSVLAVVALAGCGSGGTAPVSVGTLPSRSTTTTTTAAPTTTSEPAASTSLQAPAAAPAPGTAAPAITEATAPPVTTPAPTAPATTQVALYFTRDERVEKTLRAVPKVTRIGTEAMKALLAGPTPDEREAGLSTAIPAGTVFRDLVINEGVARVDLSRTFESGGGLGLTLRLAQVVCTLDAFPTVSGVRFALDGEEVDVLSGDGVVVDSPVSCDSYRDYVTAT